jgi:hypothetical protein
MLPISLKKWSASCAMIATGTFPFQYLLIKTELFISTRCHAMTGFIYFLFFQNDVIRHILEKNWHHPWYSLFQQPIGANSALRFSVDKHVIRWIITQRKYVQCVCRGSSWTRSTGCGLYPRRSNDWKQEAELRLTWKPLQYFTPCYVWSFLCVCVCCVVWWA